MMSGIICKGISKLVARKHYRKEECLEIEGFIDSTGRCNLGLASVGNFEGTQERKPSVKLNEQVCS
jgi:hypothetical protein